MFMIAHVHVHVRIYVHILDMGVVNGDVWVSHGVSQGTVHGLMCMKLDSKVR